MYTVLQTEFLITLSKHYFVESCPGSGLCSPLGPLKSHLDPFLKLALICKALCTLYSYPEVLPIFG